MMPKAEVKFRLILDPNYLYNFGVNNIDAVDWSGLLTKVLSK